MRAERGFLVAGRYELAELIAIGGMGEVWRARDVVLNRPVAVKLLRSEHAGDVAFLARFRDEARHAAGLAHPNIATVHDYGEQDGWAFLVMELVEGESLAARLARTGPTGAAPVVGVLGQVGDALAVAHRAGIVHRDVKPANILLTPDGRVKLTDFGIAKAMGASSHTASGVVVGTARYLSPEQATGAPTSPASDVYALGLVAYEMLTGHPPFTGASDVAVALSHVRDLPPSLPGDVPPALSTLIGECLAKDPARRPVDGAAFTGRLRSLDLSAGGAGTTRPVAPPVAPPAGVPGEPEPTRIDPGSRGHGSGTAVAPAGFAVASARGGGATVTGGRTASVLGDLPAHHRSRRRWSATVVAVIAALVIAGGGFLVARAVDDDEPAGGSTGASGDLPVTTAVPVTTPVPITTTPPTTAPPTTPAPATTSTTSTTTSTTTAPSTTTTAPTTSSPVLQFDPETDDLEVLIGEDAEEVARALEEADINYRLEDRKAGGSDRGKVVDIDTDGGPILKGGTVIVYVGAKDDGDDDD